MKCPLCACEDCPNGEPCTRRPQPYTDFYPCPSCCCMGTWRFAKQGKGGYTASIQENEERKQMVTDLSKFTGDFDKSRRNFKRKPFFTRKDLPKKGNVKAIFTSEMRENTGNGFSDFLIDIKIGKQEYVLGLQKDTVLLGQLVQALGKNPKKWKGKTAEMYLAKEKYINVSVN